jgi:hypothetical protein
MVQAREPFLVEALGHDECEVFQRAPAKVPERAELLARQA